METVSYLTVQLKRQSLTEFDVNNSSKVVDKVSEY